MVTDGDLERIDAKIRSLASSYLAEGRPYLLSRLGQDLGEDLKWIKIKLGKSLANYLTERFSADYSVVLMGEHKNIQAIVPNNASEPVSAPQLEAPGVRREPRYNYRFWAAFSVPLKTGARWLDLDEFTFQDTEERPEGNYVRIEAEFIATEQADDRVQIISGNIQKWLHKNNFAPERFTTLPRSRLGKSSSAMITGSVLEAIIQTLDRRQLATTQFSLDVVADLLRKRI